MPKSISWRNFNKMWVSRLAGVDRFPAFLWIFTSHVFIIWLYGKPIPFEGKIQLLQFVDSLSRFSYETHAWHYVESHSSSCVMGPSQNIWKWFILSNTLSKLYCNLPDSPRVIGAFVLIHCLFRLYLSRLMLPD